MSNSYVNAHWAFVSTMKELYHIGKDVTVRDLRTKELLFYNMKIVHGDERIILLPQRKSNIFAQVAETLWMLAGRNDLNYLVKYIPGARKFSDDGETWRAAYGPRLRNWFTRYGHAGTDGVAYHIDQIKEIVNKLRADPNTRQAVISLWDPEEDWIKGSKDYPCNNWLHFIQRDGILHLNVGIRSNDIVYGFSHADFFGWSVLLQCVAHWTGFQTGSINWNVTSMHIYARHFDMMNRIVEEQIPDSVYPFTTPEFPILHIDVELDEFDHMLAFVHDTEQRLEENSYIAGLDTYRGGFFGSCAALLWIHAYISVDNPYRARDLFQAMPSSDLKIAAAEYLCRQDSGEFFFDVLNDSEKDFLIKNDFLKEVAVL